MLSTETRGYFKSPYFSSVHGSGLLWSQAIWPLSSKGVRTDAWLWDSALPGTGNRMNEMSWARNLMGELWRAGHAFSTLNRKGKQKSVSVSYALATFESSSHSPSPFPWWQLEGSGHHARALLLTREAAMDVIIEWECVGFGFAVWNETGSER